MSRNVVAARESVEAQRFVQRDGGSIVGVHQEHHGFGSVELYGFGQYGSSVASAAVFFFYEEVKRFVFLKFMRDIHVAYYRILFQGQDDPEPVGGVYDFLRRPVAVIGMERKILFPVLGAVQLDFVAALAGDVSFQHHFLLLGFKLCLFRQQKIMEEVVGGIIDEIRLAAFVVILKEGQRPGYDLRACPAHPTDCSAFLPGC